MTPATARKMHWAEEEYLFMEAQSPIKHEFLNGEVFATIEHQWRGDDGAWTSEIVREGDVALAALGGAVSLGELWPGVPRRGRVHHRAIRSGRTVRGTALRSCVPDGLGFEPPTPWSAGLRPVRPLQIARW